MNLYDSPRMKTLLAALPADPDRDDALADVLRRESQYHALRDRAAAIDTRVRDISEALPDASAKETKSLQAERRDLLAERAALPMDLRVVARLYSDDLAEWHSLVLAHVAAEVPTHRAELAKSDRALRELEHTLRTATLGSPAYDDAYQRHKSIIAERKPATDRLADLAELRDLAAAYVREALTTDTTERRPGGVKLMQDGRPQDGYVRAFIDAAGKVA